MGLPGPLAESWFAGLLRDGFALAVSGEAAPFAQIGVETLRSILQSRAVTGDLEEAAAHVMAGFTQLRVHDDVAEGIRALAGLGIRLVTLSNGAASVARRLLHDAGVGDLVEQVLSVEDAGVWKPARAAYTYALHRCGVDPADAMLVAVHPWDTDGASRAGMGAVWVNRVGTVYPGYFRSPDLEVTSLVDLAAQLR